MVTDFAKIATIDTKTGEQKEFSILDLPKNVEFFGSLLGIESAKIYSDQKADRNAAEKLAELFDEIIRFNGENFQIHKMNEFFTRILFCYFAEDTEIFQKNIFTNFIEKYTDKSGFDMVEKLTKLFRILDIKPENRNNDFAEIYKTFPYVNGGVFTDEVFIPKFNASAREILLKLGELDWSEINPDIFGSMLQAVMDAGKRSELGAHYTSVPNIMKLISPLFLDELKSEAEKAKGNKTKVDNLLNRIQNIKFFDPACGSGNFLIIIYKELRNLEIELLKSINMKSIPRIEISQFYGIEIDDFAAETAKLSMYFAKHQMDLVFKKEIVYEVKSLPLEKFQNIKCANSARIDWDEVCPRKQGDEIYVVGNPPYLGSRNQEDSQKDDMKMVFKKDYKSLDYIAIWFYKGAEYIKNYNAKCAFVSTNSICQGLMVGLIWKRIFDKNIEIDFAYESFKWSNNAKKNAGVTVIIVGLRNINNNKKFLYNSANIKREVGNINGYLMNAKDVIIENRNKPISGFPIMNFGNMPADGGNLLFTEGEKNIFLEKEPDSKHFFKELLSAQELLNGGKRFCLWLEGETLDNLKKFPLIWERIEKVRKIRENSSRPQLASIPHLFAQITQEGGKDFIIIPSTTSENREYIPMGFYNENYKSANSCMVIVGAPVHLLGILMSRMHMIWVGAVGGKLKTDYRYSSTLCYNTFPFPSLSASQKEELTDLVLEMLDARNLHIGRTLAELYDPEEMPDNLRIAHKNIDNFIEKIYREKGFESDEERLEYLFDLYEKMIKEEELKNFSKK